MEFYLLYLFVFLSLLFFILSMVYIGLYYTGSENLIQVNQCPLPCPPQPPTPSPTPPILPAFYVNKPYMIRTLDGRYVQMCSGCLTGIKDCFDNGLVVSDRYNQSKFIITTLDPKSNVFYINPLITGNKQLYLRSFSSLSSVKNVYCFSPLLCTDDQCIGPDCNNQFIIKPFISQDGQFLFQIVSSNNGTYLGVNKMDDVSFENDVITDGFKDIRSNTIFLLE